MNKILPLVLILILLGKTVNAQIKSVNYNMTQNQINEGNPLPSEEPFYIKGPIPRDIIYVKTKVYKSSKNSDNAEEYTWKKPFDFPVSQYELFISAPLRSNDTYTFDFYYYQRADKEQMDELKTAINQNLASYVRANLEVSRGKIRAYQSNKVMLSQLNGIVLSGISNYSHFLHQEFEGFSDIVKQKLAQKDKLKLSRAKFNIIGKKEDSKDSDRAVYAARYIEELISLLQTEAEQYLSGNMLALVDIRSMRAYPTDKQPNTLPLNFGYGAFAIKRGFSDTQYFNGMYAGLSFPLGNKTFTRFLGNASFSTGVFVQNFTSEEGTEVSGPLIDLPIYAGLGYKLFRFIRFNAGAVAVQTGQPGSSGENFHIQPFVGLSLEFDLWLGLNQKR